MFIFAEAMSSAEYIDPILIANELEQLGAGAHEQYGLLPTSILLKLFFNFKENNTSSLKDKGNNEGTQHHILRESKISEHRERARKNQHLILTNDTNDNEEKRKHSRRVRLIHARYR